MHKCEVKESNSSFFKLIPTKLIPSNDHSEEEDESEEDPKLSARTYSPES